MAELTDQELLRMQEDAKKRVQEMQKRARLTYDTAQRPSPEPQQTPASGSKTAVSPSADGHIVDLLLHILQPAQDPVLDAMLGLLRAADEGAFTKTSSFPR